MRLKNYEAGWSDKRKRDLNNFKICSFVFCSWKIFLINIPIIFPGLLIEGICFSLVEMRKVVLEIMEQKSEHKYSKSALVAHLDYLQDKLLTKIVAKKLYNRHEVPICLKHYWDIDGPTYCPRRVINFEFIPGVKVELLQIGGIAMLEAHTAQKGYMKYAAFF